MEGSVEQEYHALISTAPLIECMGMGFLSFPFLQKYFAYLCRLLVQNGTVSLFLMVHHQQ